MTPGSFPCKLHNMRDVLDEQGLASVVSWQPHGRCFVVHDRKEFVRIIPKFFAMSKFSSFQRQLNLYGFERIPHGIDTKGYYHPLFLRGRKDLRKNIARQQVKGTGVRKPATPEKEPNFYVMDFMPAASFPIKGSSVRSTVHEGNALAQNRPQTSQLLCEEQPMQLSRNFAFIDNSEAVKPLRRDFIPLVESQYAYLRFFGNEAIRSTYPSTIRFDCSVLPPSLLSTSRSVLPQSKGGCEITSRSDSMCHTAGGNLGGKLYTPVEATSRHAAGAITHRDGSGNTRDKNKRGDQLDDDEFFDAVLDLCSMD